MHEWREYEFIIDDGEDIARRIEDLTGWETVRFEIADDDESSEAAQRPTPKA